MTDNVEIVIPPSTLRWLDEVPPDRPVVALMRHAARGHLPPGKAGYKVPVTETGASLARELGGVLGARLRSLHASPILRCVQTAELLREGSRQDLGILEDRLLGDPGVYVLDTSLAGPLWRDHGHEWVMEHLVSQRSPLPGLAAPREAARFLVQHMLWQAGDIPGIHVFVTHDSLVTATASWLQDRELGPDDWPWYLEAAWFWKGGENLHSAYREVRRSVPGGNLVGLDEGDVIEFARREIHATIGAGCPARFFLAGGAFKTLLTGRPVRDLDLWAPTPRDRELLEHLLAEKGAVPLEGTQYTDAYQLNGRVVELPRKAEPSTLEERLARFDIALSAVGVEYRPDGSWRALIHPLARESVRRREVLLLKPLVNWRHCLSTLERLRRYGGELGYHVPASEEAEVWAVFDAQTPEMQRGMIERLEASTKEDLGVRQEALCRCR